MAEVAEVGEAVPETVPEVSTSEPLPYDESLLIKDAKGRVKKPMKPDDSERNKQVEKLQEQINKHSERIKDIKVIIEERRGSAKSVSGGQKEIMRRLQDLRNQFQSVLRQKGHIRDELQEVNGAREETRALLRNIRDKTNLTKLEDIDSKIVELEERLRYESMSASDEKKVHDQLSKLNQAKPLVKDYASLTQKLTDLEVQRGQIIERLKACDDVLNEVKSNETGERAQLDAIKNAEQDQTADIPALHVEKTECYQIILSLREKIQEIRDEFNEKYKEYIKVDKAYNAYTRQIKKQQFEERKQQREEREKERQDTRQSVAAVAPENLYESEVLSCDHMLAYLKRFLAQDEAVQEVAASDLSAPAPGMKLLKKKGNDELETLFAGTGKKGKAAKKAALKEEVSKKPDPKRKLVHDLDTLKTFMMLKIEVPQTLAEVAKTNEAVVARKAEYLDKREKRKAGILPEPEAESTEAAEGAEAGSNGVVEAKTKKVDETETEAEAAEKEGVDEAKEVVDDVKASGDQANGSVVENGEAGKEAAVANGAAKVVSVDSGDVSVTLNADEDNKVVSMAVKVSEDAEA